jgi:hypothetical protein
MTGVLNVNDLLRYKLDGRKLALPAVSNMPAH